MSRKEEKKKRTFGDIVRDIILLVAVLVFLFSAYQLYKIYMVYKEGEEEYEKIREYVTEPEKSETEEEPGEKEEADEVQLPKGPQIDFEGLKKINPDIVGWLQIETLDISYPIVKGTDNDYYLHYTFEGQKNAVGAIFMDYTNSSDFEDCNTIIYGHNMKDGSMFGTFRKLHEKENFTSPYVWICTPENTWRYEIFSIHTTAASGDTYTLFSNADQEFAQYLEQMKADSELALDAVPSVEDKVITMSTCTGDSSTRFVIQAKRLSEVYENE
ncbi:MAG: class B sortase [Blautia sp.]